MTSSTAHLIKGAGLGITWGSLLPSSSSLLCKGSQLLIGWRGGSASAHRINSESKRYSMKLAIALITLGQVTLCFGACPQLPDQEDSRVTKQRSYFATLTQRQSSIFEYADCAEEWSSNAINAESLSPHVSTKTWSLVEDLANVLRRGAERANTQNAERYRSAFRSLGRLVIAALKDGQFASVDRLRKRKFIFDHGSNLKTLGARNAEIFVQELEGLSADLLGPDTIGLLVSAIDSCSAWDFVQGANRTDTEKQMNICLSDCIDYTATVVEILKPVPQVTAKAPLKRYSKMLAVCNSVAGTQSAGAGQ